MILHLNNELIDKCGITNNTINNKNFFEDIVFIRKKGFHIVLGQREILKSLYNCEELSVECRQYFRIIYNKFPTEYAIIDNFSFRINISHYNQIDESIITLNIDEIKDNCFLKSNNLILENTNDIEFYKLVLKYYLDKNSINIRYNWDLRNGGGSTIFQQYEYLSSLEDCFNFTIIDSDKKSPDGNYGSTFNNFKISPELSNFSKYIVLDVHELENLIPLNLLIKYIDNGYDSNVLGNRQYLENPSEIFKYLDLKLGTNKYFIRNLDTDDKSFFLNKLSLTEHEVNCQCTTNKKCNCYILRPFSRTIMNNILDMISDESLIIDQVDQHLLEMYDKIGKNLIEIFCHFNRDNLN